MSKQILSEEQQNIVNQWINDSKPMLVEASAGSGKTRVLTEAVRRIIKDSPKDRFKILCLTFTNKASEEMLERLADVKKIKERVFIGTTHGFALEILKTRRHELGMDEMPQIIDKRQDQIAILTEVILSNPTITKHYQQLPENSRFDSLKKHQNDLLDKCLAFISSKKQQLVWLDEDSDSYPGKGWTPSRINLYRDYNALLRNQNLIDYDDILLLAWKIINERPAVAKLYRRLYKHVLIDEAQDLSFAQYELIRALCGEKIKSIMMVGDSNQAIHGYAGASSRFMKEEFRKDFSLTNDQLKKITYNYRSSESIINLASELSGVSQSRIESYYKGHVAYSVFHNKEEEAEWIVKKINEIVGEQSDTYDGDLSLSKIAVLGRNRFVFNELISKLEEDSSLCSRFFLKRGTEILDPESAMIRIFDLGTRMICNQRAHVYYNKLIDLLDIKEQIDIDDKCGIDALEELLEKSRINYLPKSINTALLDAWKKVESDINKFPRILESLALATQEIEEENEKALAIQDIHEWKAAWSKYIRSVAANAKSIGDFRRFLAMGVTQVKNQKGLTLATVHTVKGLEFHVVFLIGMGDGTFPDYRAIKKNNLEEEKNNAYVAVTRAKRDLYISYPSVKKVPWGEIKQEKSRFFEKKDFEVQKPLLG